MFRGNLQRTGVAATTVKPSLPLEKKWEFQTGGGVVSSPAVWFPVAVGWPMFRSDLARTGWLEGRLASLRQQLGSLRQHPYAPSLASELQRLEELISSNRALGEALALLDSIKARQAALEQRDRVTVFLEQGIALGARGAAALDRGDLDEAGNALEQAQRGLQEALEKARDEDLRATIQANLRRVEANYLLLLVKRQEGASRQALEAYNQGRYQEAVEGYAAVVKAIQEIRSQAQREGLEEELPFLASALEQAQQGFRTCETARDSAQVEALAKQAGDRLAEAQSLVGQQKYVEAREALKRAGDTLEQAEELAERRRFTEALERLAAIRRQAQSLLEQVNEALRSGVPLVRGAIGFGIPSPPKAPRVEVAVPAGPLHHAGVEEAYEFLEFLGRGGQAEVWKGRRRSDGLLVALKIPLGAPGQVMTLEGQVYESFGKEVQLWQQLEHPRIVQMYEAGVGCHGAYGRGRPAPTPAPGAIALAGGPDHRRCPPRCPGLCSFGGCLPQGHQAGECSVQ